MKDIYLLNLSAENEELFKIVSENIKNSKKIVYIVPTAASIENKKNFYIEKLRGFSNVNFCTFDNLRYENSERLLIDDVFKGFILGKILRKKRYKNLKYSKGLIEVMLDFINKAKENVIKPEVFLESENEILREVSDLYLNYEKFLEENRLTDGIEIKETYRVDADLIIVDEFYSLSEIEYDLMEKLSKNIDVIVNVPYFLSDLQLARSMVNRFKKMGFKEKDLRDNCSISSFVVERKNIGSISLISKGGEENLREVFKEIKKDVINGGNSKSTALIPFSSELDSLLKVAKMENIPVNLLMGVQNQGVLIKEFVDLINYLQDQSRENILKRIKLNYFKITDAIEEMEYEVAKLNFNNLSELIENTSITINIKNENLSEFIDLLDKLSQLPSNNLSFGEYSDFFKELVINAKEEVYENYQKTENIDILKRDIGAVDFLMGIFERIEVFDKYFIGNNFLNYCELLLSYIEGFNYREINDYAPDVLGVEQALGVKFKKCFILNLDSKYPNVKGKNFIFAAMSKEELDYFPEEGEEFIAEKSLLLLLNIVGNSNKTYVLEESEDVSIYFELFEGAEKIDNEKESTLLELSLSLLRDFEIESLEIANGKGEDFLNYKEILKKVNCTLLDKEPKLSDNAKIKLNNHIKKRSFAVSDFDVYVECPYKYLYSRLVAVEEMRREYEDEFYLDMGNFYHKVLERYFSAYPMELNKDYLEHIVRVELFKDIPLEVELGGIDKIKYENVLSILKSFIEMDLAVRENFIPYKFEVPIELRLGEIVIKGRIDRIDRDGNLTLLTDYKSSRAISIGQIKKGEAFQLPLYIMSQGNGVVGARYGIIKSGEYKDVLVQAGHLTGKLKEGQLEEIIEHSKNKVEEIINLIIAGNFKRKDRDLIKGDECKNCEYRDLCRQVIL
ncbi:PD-(D/E)XK nuclease family protein [Anaerosphaera multitolerans]|uniref:PD-(D/E)XK nuclease family protein n=1 Tax=Anaerosphaera multitolerans TaxID=2487351 RepID=A0A437S6G9_9FIRM|nr:PD-(D/E)XK nuclease family protein [Anaerosphaera multitolerans]RVU54584.1 PD-(D/E)XK nuclease family protein [Anaerosphaera multitolerans]